MPVCKRIPIMKDMDPEKEICSFLEKKRTFFDQYLSLTKEMKETFEDKKVKYFGGLLSQRQDCIRRIEKIDASIKKIINASSYNRNHMSPPTRPLPLQGRGKGVGQRSIIDSYLTDIKRVMETADRLERELTSLVKEEGESIKRELLEMRNVRQAAKGYKNDIEYSPRFLNTMR